MTSRWSPSTTTARRRSPRGHRAGRPRRQRRDRDAEAAARAGHRALADARDRVRARHPRGHGLAHLHVHHLPRHRGARGLRAPGREPGAARALPAWTAAARPANLLRVCRRTARSRRSPAARGFGVGRRRRLRGGRLHARLARGRGLDWDVLLLSVEMEARVLVVGRSRTSALAVDEALPPAAGGGHAQAAPRSCVRPAPRRCSSARSPRSPASPARRCARAR